MRARSGARNPDARAAAQERALRAAQAAQRAGRLEEAEAAYRRLLAAAPTAPHLLGALAQLRLARGDAADALGLLERALARRPDDPALRLLRGRALAALGRPAAAPDAAGRDGPAGAGPAGGDGDILPVPAAFADAAGRPRFTMPVPRAFLTDPGVRALVLEERRDGGFEHATRRFLDTHLEPGDLLIDVGAHWGVYALHAATRWPGQVRVLAVEPSPVNVEQLRRWVARNGLGGQVEVVAAGAADREGFATIAPQSTMGHHLEAISAAAEGAGLRVPTVTLDGLLAARPDLRSRRTFLKVDVEGLEPEVVEGGKDLLAGGRVRALIFEKGRSYDTAAGRPRWLALLARLGSLGFSLWRLPHENLGGPLVPYAVNDNLCNVFALAPDFVRAPRYAKPFGTLKPPFRIARRRTPAERLAEAAALVAARTVDVERWAVPDESGAAVARAGAAASLVPAGARGVVDLGAGAMQLRHLLDPACRYLPADLFPFAPDMAILDLERDPWDGLGRPDVAVATGLLAHLHDPAGFLARLGGLAPAAVLSYPLKEPGESVEQRRLSGFFNDFDPTGLEDLLARTGWRVEQALRLGHGEAVLRLARAGGAPGPGVPSPAGDGTGGGGAALPDAAPADPARAEAAFQAAVAHHKAGRLDAAEALYRRLAAAAPDQPNVLGWLAKLRYERGDAAEAAALAERALARRPDDPWFMLIAATSLRAAGRLDAAEALYARAFARDPGNLNLRLNYGNLLNERHRYEEAVAMLAPAAEREGNAAQSLGFALRHLGRIDEAVAAQRRALALDPGLAGAHLELGMGLLTRGELAEGFAAYAWRHKVKDFVPPALPGPAWDGEAPLSGRRVLVWTEQGLGDTIQLARFLRPLAALGARPVLRCQPVLKALLQGLPGAVAVVGEREPLPAYDLTAPLMSLPELLGTTLDTLPAEVPYLRADPARVARWRERLRPGAGLVVGVAWQGKPTAKIDHGRSFPLRLLAPLAALPGVRLVSLQKEHGRDQLRDLPPGMTVEELGPDLDAGPDAFLDTAAVMEGLDLVVTSDTSVAHLAGALARPVWVALKHAPDWRWLRGRDDSPWYPTMRLFRQATPGDWAPVFRAMAAAAKVLLEGRSA